MFYSNYQNAVKAFKKNDYEQAKKLFLQVIKQQEAPESYFFLGKIYFLSDEKNNAINYLEEYLELNQHNFDEIEKISHAFDMLGQCYETVNNDNYAIECYKKATIINPYCASAWHNMGSAHIKLALYYLEQDLNHGRLLFKDASSFLDKALALCSNNPLFLLTAAHWHQQYIQLLLKEQIREEEDIHANFQSAIQYHQKALALCDEKDIKLSKTVILSLAECLEQYEDYECKEYTHKQQLADAWLTIARTYQLEEDLENAKYALNKAKKLAPEDYSILKELTLIEFQTQFTPHTLFGQTHSSQNSMEIEEDTMQFSSLK